MKINLHRFFFDFPFGLVFEESQEFYEFSIGAFVKCMNQLRYLTILLNDYKIFWSWNHLNLLALDKGNFKKTVIVHDILLEVYVYQEEIE